MENAPRPAVAVSFGERLERWLKMIQAARGSMTTSKAFGKLDYQASSQITAAEAVLDRLSSEVADFRSVLAASA